MSENVRKLIGVVVMAVLVVVGVAVSSGDDTDFTRNRSFSAAAETFAGADRLEDPDCCDQNAYEILKLETQLAEMNNKVASLDAELDELQQLQASIPGGQDSPQLQETALAVYNYCSNFQINSTYPWDQGIKGQAGCYREALVGLEIGFAKALVALDPDGFEASAPPKFAVFHRSSKADIQSAEVLTAEACVPIFMNGYSRLLALDTVAGLVAHPKHFSFWPGSQFGNAVLKSSVYSAGTYSGGDWDEWVTDNDLCK